MCGPHSNTFPPFLLSVLLHSALASFYHTPHAHVHTSLLALFSSQTRVHPRSWPIPLSLVPASHLLRRVLTHSMGLPSKPVPIYSDTHFHPSVGHFILLKLKKHLAWDIFSPLTFTPKKLAESSVHIGRISAGSKISELIRSSSNRADELGSKNGGQAGKKAK